MAEQNQRKLNRLQQLPEQVLVDAAWLERHGYSSSLRHQYVKAGWLTQVAPRVYRRTQEPLTWRQVMISVQSFMGYPLTIGGRSALEEQGYSHYLGDRPEVHLYGPSKPPGWLAKLDLDVTFQWHNATKLFPAEPLDPFGPSPPSDDMVPGNFMLGPNGVTWPLCLSSPERAFLELLDELPDHESFHQVDMLVEGLVNLSPSRLQILLQQCRSVKVKRLFFVFADRHRHAWRDRLDPAQFDLGSGKRALVPGGRLSKSYGITVPEDLLGHV
jgi:hypothetical protein